jgi:UDP-sulfoquinovose synthase
VGDEGVRAGLPPGEARHDGRVRDAQHRHRRGLHRDRACRIWDFRATDLNQGIVYGIETEQTALHPDLATRFDYDEIFGTVLNRFCLQAVIGQPLTVYGKGGQTRGFINIRDTLRCVELACENPADRGEMRVYNQFTETFTVWELAKTVQKAMADYGGEIEIVPVPDPRVEAEEHYFNPKAEKLLSLGLEPHFLSDELVKSVFSMIERHRYRVIESAILPATKWR